MLFFISNNIIMIIIIVAVIISTSYRIIVIIDRRERFMFLNVDIQGWNFIEFEPENNAVEFLILT